MKGNIVVEEHVAKLVDYGLGFCAENTDADKPDVFKAPELTDPHNRHPKTPTQQSDIYAMAYIFYEVCSICPLDGKPCDIDVTCVRY